jgi:CRISPR/Cas system-associated exonuclease Cas4 (RecB family)
VRRVVSRRVDEEMSSHRVIRASEIGQYAYCARAWWLGSVQGQPSSHQREMTAGEMVHRRHGREVRMTTQLTLLAYILLAMAIILGVLWLIGLVT